jgi:Mlc titration factor MtfA (ptsG expression regulator)
LTEPEAGRLKELTTIFLDEKQFEAVQGLVLDPLQKASIAVQACLPILHLGLDWYNGWSTLILTPKEFKEKRRDHDGALIHEYDEDLGGEVMELGPVVLSWRDVEDSGWGDGYNVVIHEMAHKLDLQSGDYDGCPPLHRGMDYSAWTRAFTEAYEDLRGRVKRLGKRAEKALAIDPYAATDPAEFFAVCTEYFFEKPRVLRKEYPGVYDQLVLFYKQEPIEPTAG